MPSKIKIKGEINRILRYLYTLNVWRLNTKLVLAILCVALVWGTTFLGIKIGVETIPPWFVAGLRQFLAALIVLPILLFRKEFAWIGWKNFRIQATLSLLMLVGANGLTTVAEQNLSSSLTSLISALSPVMIFIVSLVVGLQKFSIKAFVGILLGFSGVAFIFWDGLEDLLEPQYLQGIIILFLAILSWAIGTVFAKKVSSKSGQNLILNLFYQFALAGVVQLIFAFAFSKSIDVQTWSFKSMGAVLYLAVFGSVTTFFAYHYILQKLMPTQVSMLSYVNTIIAIFLGWLILDEEISIKFVVATILIISGVFIMNYRKGMLKR